MAIRTVVTRGYGNGTFNGTIALVTLRGYVASVVIVLPDDPFEEPLSVPFAPGQFLTVPGKRYLESAAAQGLYSSCILQLSSQLQDGQGGYQEDYLNTYLDIPCRLMRGSGTGGSLGAGRTTNRRAILTLLASQQVTEDMRVWIDGVVWEVVRVHRPSTYATVQRVVVRRVD